MSLNITTPHDILELVNFNIEENNKWVYDSQNKDMYSYQAEGSAGLWNRLEHFGLAILADEVGMGKTYQALALVAKQFQNKADSKVLIIAPRYEVLRQWKDEEYKEFRDKHLKNKDLLPSEDKIIALENFKDGFDLEKKEAQIVFAKTTSFEIDRNDSKYELYIEKCQNDGKQFDLVIVDEAHKYRNFSPTHEIIHRTKNAHAIFEGLTTKIVLMTATPLHSSKNDILNIVNVFKPNIFDNYEIEKTSDAIMKKLMIRRLRVLTNYNKYHYRSEKDLPVTISSEKNDYKDELFFAMLQRKMIINKTLNVDYTKSKNMLDLLEGTTYDENFNKENENKLLEEEYKVVKKLFNEVVGNFKSAYHGQSPSNQKYKEVLKQIENDDEKALVFVRRRASAIELTRQYIEAFDCNAWSKLSKVHKIPNRKNREEFDILLGLNKIDKNIDMFIKKINHIDEDNTFTKLYKKYLNSTQHFKTVQKIMANHFIENYNSMDSFSINFEIFKEEIKKNQENNSIVDIGEQLPKSIILSFFKRNKGEVSTSASRFVRKFDKGKKYENFFTEWLPKKVGYTNHKDKYNLIKSAVLHSSIGVVELFSCDIRTKNYEKFCIKVEKNINSFSFVKEIKLFLDNFEKYEKYLTLNSNSTNDEKTDNTHNKIDIYDEKIFHNSQPAYAYLSNTKNENVIARFNSPFFPNLLCGTSTLQEGLNLHLQCNKVYHFGSAYTMGDDEQRTGRVDRIHGKMHRELKENMNSKLYIHYPYLKNTFDEENLRNMLYSKRSTEKLIDICRIEANITDVKNIINKNQCEKSIEDLIRKDNVDNFPDLTEPFGWKIE